MVVILTRKFPDDSRHDIDVRIDNINTQRTFIHFYSTIKHFYKEDIFNVTKRCIR